MSTKREVEHARTDARYVACIRLSTGKTVTLGSEWKPYHWEEVEQRRLALVGNARHEAQRLCDEYGVECTGITVHREERKVERVVETTVRFRFDSEHYLEGKTR